MPSEARLGVSLGVLMTLLLGLMLSAQPGDPRASQTEQILRKIFVTPIERYIKTRSGVADGP